jgi:hypothetical protein
LLGPACDLALEVVAGPAVAGQARGLHVDLVQRGDHAVHLVVDRGAFGAGHAGQRLVPQHAARDELHHVERAADHRLVLAQQEHARHRHGGGVQRLHHRELAVDRVGRRQQPGRRAGLAAHHVLATRRDRA